MIEEDLSTIISNYYAIYGVEANQHRAIPSCIDCLKPSQRRVIVSCFNTAKSKFAKSNTVIGETMKAHAHGDASIYSTMVNMAQRKILDGDGNFGLNTGLQEEPPAASRYTSIKLNEDIAKLIEKTFHDVQMVEGDLVMEPMYIPAVVPIGLINNSSETQHLSGVGMGARTSIPTFKLSDLLRRTLNIIEDTKPLFVPKWDSVDAKELKVLYETGKESVPVTGHYSMVNDLELVITKFPFGASGTAFLNKFSDMINSGFVMFSDESDSKTKVVLKTNTRRKMDELLKKLNRAMKTTQAFDFIVSNIETGKIARMNLDDILKMNLKYYVAALKVNFQKKIDKLSSAIDEMKLIQILRPFVRDELNSLKTDEIDVIMKRISDKSKVEFDSVSSIFGKYTIKRLLSVNTDITEQEKEKAILEKRKSDLKTEVITEIKELL